MAILLGRDDIVHELLAKDDAPLNQPVKLQSCPNKRIDSNHNVGYAIWGE